MFVRSILLLFILYSPYIYLFGDNHARVRRQSNSSCVTPRGETGVCVKLKKCPSLYASLIGSHGENIHYIERSLCGIETGGSKVCCLNATLSVVRPRPATPRNPTSGIERGNPDICGKPTSIDAIFNPNATSSGESQSAAGNWPWMVSIRYEYYREHYIGSSAYRVGIKCGGILISKQYVLTVASCLSKRIPIHSLRLGISDMGSDTDGASSVDLQADRVIIHPQYALVPRLINNIALIRLNRSVEYTPTIRPVCLPNGSQYLTDDYYYKRIPFLVGWDEESKLFDLETEMVNISKCKKNHENFLTIIDQRVLCAGTKEADCSGDSYGPLFFAELNDKAEIVYYLGGLGITSFGKKCDKPGFPGVYSRIAAYIDWISQTTGLKF